jgi:hypothetical protein
MSILKIPDRVHLQLRVPGRVGAGHVFARFERDLQIDESTIERVVASIAVPSFATPLEELELLRAGLVKYFNARFEELVHVTAERIASEIVGLEPRGKSADPPVTIGIEEPPA